MEAIAVQHSGLHWCEFDLLDRTTGKRIVAVVSCSHHCERDRSLATRPLVSLCCPCSPLSPSHLRLGALCYR